MSLDESGMAGVLSANKPIDAEFLKSLGFTESSYRPGMFQLISSDTYLWWIEDRGVVYVVQTMQAVNTQGRFLHLLAALGIEVPNG